MFVKQAIVTHYFSPSNVKGSRVKAAAAAGSVTLHWDHSMNPEQNHAKAAETLAKKFSWHGGWYQGAMPNDSGYCFVSCDSRDIVPTFTIEKELAP